MGTSNSKVKDVLSIVNYPARRLPGPGLLHLLVQSSSQDGQPAIDFLAADGSRVSLSYDQLHHESEILAAKISALAGPQEKSKPFVVPVLVQQSPELYIALLAILKAGGAFCPMNLDVPFERAKFILGDVSATLVVTTSALASKLPQGDHSVLLIDEQKPLEPLAITKHKESNPTDLAYVMYTSGSTGTPKGVGVSHDAATQSLLAHDRHIPAFSRFLQFAAPTFDVSVFEIFFPFLRGKTLVSCSRPAMLNDLPGIISKMEVDACELTPSVAGSLLRNRENTPGLKLLLTIGEMLTQPVVEEFGGSSERESMLWGMYGPTEAAIHCTLQPAFAHNSTVRNIGIPLDTVSAFILKISENDAAETEFEVLPRGEIGELAVGGYQLADGYLNRPEQTASAFIDTRYGRLYRTGDKAKMLPDGSLECLGRIADGQVKLRGQRMELGEVEHAALRTPGCHSAVAAVIDSTLILFCAVDGTADMAEALMESCKRWLPGFMLPGDVVVVDSFPRLASGKVDRKRLAADYRARETGPVQGVEYKDELERRLCALASGCLRNRIEPSQDLSRAGLDSLSAIKLASALREEGFEVDVVELLEMRMISALHSRLSSNPESSARGSTQNAEGSLELLDTPIILADHPGLSVNAERIQAIIPCTPLQSSMLAETSADPRAYCNWVELSFPGTPEEGAISSWFLQLAHTNEILRTGFVHHKGRFLQVVFKALDDANILTTREVSREFEFREEPDFLRPFRIQISSSSEGTGTTVVLQLHHAVYDGWSMDIMLSDLAKLARGGLLQPRPQFRQISKYHQSVAYRESCEAAREFWAGNLLGFQPPPLPILVPTIAHSSPVLSSTISLEIDPQELKEALKRFDCGPQTIFQAALAWLWSTMVGTEDVVVGCVTSGRIVPVSRIEDIIGPCIASVPLRTILSQVRTIRDLVIGIQASNRAILSHSVLPLAEIKRAAGFRSSQSIYDVLFVYQETLSSKRQASNVFKQVAQQDYLETKLVMEVEPEDNSFDCRFTYHSDVFPESQVNVIADSIRALVPFMLGNLDSKLFSMHQAFSQQLLSIFNPTPMAFSGVPDLAYAVELVATEFPDKDAVCFADHISDGRITTTTITFGELNEIADRIAWHLAQQGVREGEAVAIIMEKSISLYAGILAILKAGCAYLPLLSSTPVVRTEIILQQAKVNVCLVDSVTRGKLEGNVPCTFLDLQALDLQSGPRSSFKPSADPNRLAYIIYTSGSTGVPKGVCVTQLNIMSNLDVLSRIYPVGEDSRLLQSCSQAFDVSVFEIFFAWTQGMCLCSGTNDKLFEDLERAIRKLNVTHLSMTPTVASLVDPAKVPRVRLLVTAGEAMTEVVARKWQDKLYQGYGPSETTNICSVKKMGPNQIMQHLGWSFENTSTFVLDKNGLELVPFGCLGEFCFGGDQVAQGYLNNEELTASKFINHPTFGRIYRSGDLGRMLPDGSMVIVGRADEQIKIRGQRVELNEITETIRQSGDVVDCATLFLRAGEAGSQDQIVSFMVHRQREDFQFHVPKLDADLKRGIRSLFHALASRLPAYMVPSAIIPISVLPTTASGKLDRARLRQAFNHLSNDHLALVSQGYELTSGDGEWSMMERQVAETVSNALHVDKGDIQRWTPLTTLGLDSVSAIQLSRQLHKQLRKRLPISAILQNASVARLAQALPVPDAAATQHEESLELLPTALVEQAAGRLKAQGKPFSKVLPCTPLQEVMLASPAGKDGYLNRMLFKVKGDMTRLKEAWNTMCARHDILRTCFVATDDSRWPILQVVLDQSHLRWHVFNASGFTIEGCISQHAQGVPSALESMEPAVSLATVTKGDDIYLSFICHHALYDGVAIERLLLEVEQHIYGVCLPPTSSYELFLHGALKLPASTESFWLRHLASFEPKLVTRLLTEVEAVHLNPDLDIPLSDVKAKTRELGVSMLALTQSAWAITLASLFRTSDICFGNVVNGRSLPVDGINELVAPCFNTIPVRMDISRSQRNLDLMKSFQNLNTQLMQYQFTPLRRIQSLFSQHEGRRLFDTLLLLQQSPRVLDQSVWTLEKDEGEMDVPLVCEVIPDTHINRLIIKIHKTERQPLPSVLVDLVSALFTCAIRNCLRFPGSHSALDDVPGEVAETLSMVKLEQPETAARLALDDLSGATEQWTSTESTIRTVFASLSSSEADWIRRKTTIYQLGLDSISAVQIATMLRKLGHQVLASDVIENPTCESLARHIDTRAPDLGAARQYDFAKFQTQIQPQILASGFIRNNIESVMPCTPLQSSMMAQFIKSGSRDYFNYVDFELENGISAAKLAEGWQVLCRTYPILRTAIVPVEHDECAFAMVQLPPSTFRPALTIFSNELAGTFSLENWRLKAAQAAARTPHQTLWAVAILESDNRISMHLAIHHVLYDARSLQILLENLARALAGYQIFPSVSTEDAVSDILSQITAGAEKPAAFWKKQADKIVINTFPVMTPLRERSRKTLVESATGAISLSVLEEAASRSGFTLQVILQAAWTRVLSAYLGEKSVVFGVVLSGRNTEATRNAVFPCITTLPVVCTNTASNHDLLAQMLQYNTELYKQQHKPLTRIHQWLGCADSRLFDTLLAYQKFDLETSAERPWRVVAEEASVDYPLSIEIEPVLGDQLWYRVTFFSDMMAREQAALLLRQFDAAVHHLALQPHGHEADLVKTSPQLFSILPPEVPEISTTVKFLHQFVELQALNGPENTALYFVERFTGEAPVGRKLTYKQLDENGNRVAHVLSPYVKPGDIVAVYFDKSPEAYISILGILKAGCAFLALDTGAPRERNEFILHDSGAAVLITSKQMKDNLQLAVPVPVIGIAEEDLMALPAVPPVLSRELNPHDVSYCLYTSGTTGTPKGCEITHDNTVQCMLAFQHIFRGHWQEDSKWLQFASLHFDVSVLEQYWSWSVGIALVAAPRDLILEDLAGAIRRLGITHIDLTPSLARLLHPDEVPSLCRGVFITGGESLKQEILDIWGSKRVIYNFYGPTEATIGVTVFPRVPMTGRASNIGRQFINVGSYVLKPGTQQPVLKGGVGELCVSGRLVGKGYLKREDLTCEKFPTLGHFGERVYRTGDLVRVLHDGCFDFLGRADDQVKLRGQRLEIGEINHAIRKGVDAVKDVATLVVRNEAQKKDMLVSFIVSDGETRGKEQARELEVVEGSEAAELCHRARDACRSKLPAYMVPTYVLQLSVIPLSANNKLEIKQLRQFFVSLGHEKVMALSSSADQSRQGLNRTGTRIAGLIATMQGIEMTSVAPESSIFELGMDSISVLRLSRILKKEGFAHANPSLILQHPLIADLATALDKKGSSSYSNLVTSAKQLVQACAHRHRAHVCRELGITPDQIEYIAPCSPLQQGMISRSALEDAYFNTFQFKLAPDISTTLLHAAFEKAVEALPILRTKFVGTTDGFVQVAVKDEPLPWSEVQLDHGMSTKQMLGKTRDGWIAQNQGSLVRPMEAVVVNGENDALLVLHIFHGLYDANSFQLILEQVAAEYRRLRSSSSNGTASLPAPSFLDALCYGPLQDFSNSKPFWVEHLAGAAHEPPIKRSSTPKAISIRRTLPFEDFEALRTRLGVTHQALVQAAWVSILAEHLSANPTIGIIVSGRNIALDGAERVVGPLFNTLPFHGRVSLQDGASVTTWASLIQQCHDFNTAVLPFQHVPLRDIQKWCLRGRPLFDTLFSFQREEKSPTDEDNLWTVLDSEPNADYTLALEATLESDHWLRLLLVAQDDQESSDKLSAMMDRLEQAFSAMIRSPGSPVSSPGSDSRQGGTAEAVQDGHVTNGFETNRTQAVLGSAEPSFTWTEEAVVIRKEMAALADVEAEAVTETTPIFGLGLDSIDAIKLSARLKKHGIHIKTSELLKAQTIDALLRLLHPQHRISSRNGANGSLKTKQLAEVTSAFREYLAPQSELNDGDIVLPATPLQESMVAKMLASDFQFYFNHDVLALSPGIDVDKLKQAWKTVIEGSPILRTRFLLVENSSIRSSYCQVIGNNSPCYISDVTLDHRDDLDKICDTATLRAQKGAGRSDLLQLVFATVNNQRFLVVSIAHALYDGWSLELIHRDVQAAYDGRYRPCGIESYLNQLENILILEQGDAFTFWSGFLQDAHPTMLRETSTDSKEKRLVHRNEVVSSLSASEIMSFCKANGVTLQTLGQACWASLLASQTQSLDVTFGVVLSCRDSEAMEELVFPTMNTVPVRSVLHGTISSWLRYMQDNTTGIAAYQHFPLREAQKLAQTKGPLFNTLFIQQRSSSSHNQGNGGWLKSIGGSSAVEYPVCVEMEMTGSGLVWRLACEGGYASKDKIASMLQELDQVLGHMIRSPEADVLAFSGQGLSICGLLPTELKAAPPAPSVSTNGIAVAESERWSHLEATIRDVLAEASGVEAASIMKSNNLYHLGLDSISAVKMGSLLKRRGVIIGFRDMLKAGSIAEMVQLAQDASSTQSLDATSTESTAQDGFVISEEVDLPALLQQAGIQQLTVEQVLPASAMQVHMLSVWQNTKGEVFYPCFWYKLCGPVDGDTIAAAWTALVTEILPLRTVFLSTKSANIPILQLVLAPSAIHQGKTSPDATTWDSQTTGALAQPYASLHAEKVDQERWALRLRIHHALYDAISLPAIMDRFASLCGVNKAQEQAVPAFNWGCTLIRHLSDDNRAARKQFWTGYLAGTEPNPLCAEHKPQSSKSRIGVVDHAALQDISGITETCKARGVSFQALFFAAYAEFLASTAVASRKERPQSVVFGIYLANRTETSEPGASFYPFLRLVPLRVDLSEGASLFDTAVEIQMGIHTISTPANVEVGMWEIKEWTGVRVDSFVNFLGAPTTFAQGVQRHVRLEVMDEQAADRVVMDQGDDGYTDLPELAGNAVRDAYPDAVDVEVSLHGDDMTIGVFGSGVQLGNESGARRIIDGIVDVLKGAV
ncbi:hypothetical protein VTI74DRAFT_1220 [Chaetomium olivicolor]